MTNKHIRVQRRKHRTVRWRNRGGGPLWSFPLYNAVSSRVTSVSKTPSQSPSHAPTVPQTSDDTHKTWVISSAYRSFQTGVTGVINEAATGVMTGLQQSLEDLTNPDVSVFTPPSVASETIDNVSATAVWFKKYTTNLFCEVATEVYETTRDFLANPSTWIAICVICLMYCFFTGVITIPFFCQILVSIKDSALYIGPLLRNFFKCIYEWGVYLELVLIRMFFWFQRFFFCRGKNTDESN